MTSIEDDDLQRLSDLDLLSGEPVAIGLGQQAEVRSLKGRSRGYVLRGATTAKSAVALALHERCDLVVATAAIYGYEQPDDRLTHVVASWLAADDVFQWIERQIGL